MSREEDNKKEGQMQQVQRLWALHQDLPDACGWRRWRNNNSKEEVVICPFQFYFVSGPITHVAILWNVEKGNLLKTLLDHHSSHPRRRSPQKGRRHQRRRRPPKKKKTPAKKKQKQAEAAPAPSVVRSLKAWLNMSAGGS